jgi:hypothetical protein
MRLREDNEWDDKQPTCDQNELVNVSGSVSAGMAPGLEFRLDLVQVQGVNKPRIRGTLVVS